MSKTKTSARKKRANPQADDALASGLHAAKIEMRSGSTFRVRTLEGTRVSAVLDDELDPGLAEECLRAGRLVIVCNTSRGPTVLGALQTARAIERDADGTATIVGAEIRLRAERGLLLEAGPVSLRLDKNGLVRIDGTKMTIDLTSMLKVLAAKVELP